METLLAYLPMDRRQALAQGVDLPDRTSGAALFADISGFTALTETLARELGPQRGAEELTRQLNLVYDALIAQVDRYGGSVIGFSGDAITCWFDDLGVGSWEAGVGTLSPTPSSQLPTAAPLRATACALEMQAAMAPFALITTPSGSTVALAIKAAVASGPARRFVVGDPTVQLLDVLAGATLDRLAAAEQRATKGEVVVTAEVAAALGASAAVTWRDDPTTAERYAVVERLVASADLPWPALAPDALSETQLRPWLLPMVYQRLRGAQGAFLAELRPAVALFVRFEGIDFDDDPAAGAQLDSYIRWVQQTLARYEGVLLDVTIGDKGSYLYGAFGAPIAHEDDPARAVAAALDVRAPPATLDFVRGVRIGLSRGRMRAGPYGGATRRTYGVLGDEVNMAARLMTKAEQGQVLVSQRIADAVGQSYQLAPVGLLHVKGKQAPVAASLVLGRQQPGLQQPAARFAGPLVGRDGELARMDRVLEDALAGAGQVLRLEGGAGIGKSRLAAAFAVRAADRGLHVATGHCQNISQESAYTPWRQVFRQLLGLEAENLGLQLGAPTASKAPSPLADPVAHVEAQIAQLNPDWLLRLPLLADLLGLTISDNPTTAGFEPRLRQLALFALAVDLVQAWARSAPLLLVIEDAHWMDEASRALTLALARVIGKASIVLALVQRPPLREDRPLLSELNRLPYHQQIVLGELDPEGVAELVATRLEGQPDPLALALVLAQAQGHPFFTEELVHTLRELGRLERQPDGAWILSAATISALRDAKCLVRSAESGAWLLAPTALLSIANLGIPDSIHGVVLSRMDRLPEDHKFTLKVASVIGHIFDYEVLAHAHPAHPDQDDLLDQIDLLENRDFARMELPPPQLAYAFKHSITQEVTYTTLLEIQQRELHLAVGMTLEVVQPDAVETLAYHYRRGGVRDKLLFYLEQAAHKAQREYANETALSYYQEALALEERWEWRKGQVGILHILGQREEQEAALRAFEANPNAPAFESAYLWGQYHEAVGDYTAARAAVEQAVAACRSGGARVDEVRCLVQLGLIARRQGDYEQAKRWYQEALAQLPGEQAYSGQEARALAQTLSGLGIVQRQQGQFDEARASYQRALALSRQASDRQIEAEVLNGLGVTAYYQRQFAEALTDHRHALEIRRTIGDRAGQGTSLYNLALTVQETGDYGQAQQHLVAALAIQQAIDNRWEEVNVWNGLGILHQELGDFAQAQAYLQRGLSLCQEIGDESGQVYLLSNLGLAMRDQGDLLAAERILRDGLALAQQQDDRYQVSFFQSYLSTVYLQAGRAGEAIEHASEALNLRRELGLHVRTTADLTTLAAAYLARADLERALEYARQALVILEECQGEGPEFPQRDYFVCYHVLAAAGQTEPAQAALGAAYDLVMARAQNIGDPALRQSFLERVPINRAIKDSYLPPDQRQI